MTSIIDILEENAERFPDKSSSRMDGRERTWSETAMRSAQLGGALRELGVKMGDRVAILALNSDRYWEQNFAAWWIGASNVPLNVRWSVDEQIYSLSDAGAETLFIDDTFLPMLPALQAKVKSLKHIIHIGDGAAPEGTYSFDTLTSEGKAVPRADFDGEHIAGLYYTGGTTGFPKGVKIAHRGFHYNAMVRASVFDIGEDEICMHAAPMFHVADLASSGLATSAAATHVFVDAFEPQKYMEAVGKYQATMGMLVPTMWGMLFAHPAFDPAKLASLRYSFYGGSAMPEGLLRSIMAALPEVKLCQGYGQTEMSPLITTLLPEDHVVDGPRARLLRSAGKPIDGMELKICDDDGNEVPQGTVGQIVSRSPGSMLGYWNKPEQTADTLDEGWVKTGDGGYLDEEGYLFIVDRIKDMIVTGGENVFSAEVESVISTHPDVEAVAVIGIPSDKWGETVHAIVIAKPDTKLTEDEVVNHVRGKIANYKIPRSVSFRSEPFPISGAGKVLKRELRQPFWEGDS